MLDRIAAEQPTAERLEVWFLDEARVGQKGRMTRRWFLRGQRPRMVKDLRYRSAYIFGAVCPERDTGVALVLPEVSTTGMNLLLHEIAGQVSQGRHAVVLIDNAGWHVTDKVQVPPNLTLVNLPPYSPELNAIERVWQYLRDRYLSGCLLTDDAAILDACCDAWNRLLAEKGRIRSLADRAWIYPVSP